MMDHDLDEMASNLHEAMLLLQTVMSVNLTRESKASIAGNVMMANSHLIEAVDHLRSIEKRRSETTTTTGE